MSVFKRVLVGIVDAELCWRRGTEEQDIDETEMIGEIGRINDVEGQRGSLRAVLAVILNIEIYLQTTPGGSVNSCLCYIPISTIMQGASVANKKTDSEICG